MNLCYCYLKIRKCMKKIQNWKMKIIYANLQNYCCVYKCCSNVGEYDFSSQDFLSLQWEKYLIFSQDFASRGLYTQSCPQHINIWVNTSKAQHTCQCSYVLLPRPGLCYLDEFSFSEAKCDFRVEHSNCTHLTAHKNTL